MDVGLFLTVELDAIVVLLYEIMAPYGLWRAGPSSHVHPSLCPLDWGRRCDNQQRGIIDELAFAIFFVVLHNEWAHRHALLGGWAAHDQQALPMGPGLTLTLCLNSCEV